MLNKPNIPRQHHHGANHLYVYSVGPQPAPIDAPTIQSIVVLFQSLFVHEGYIRHIFTIMNGDNIFSPEIVSSNFKYIINFTSKTN